MRIRLIIGQYPERYEGELMPNVLDAWDEFTLDDNQQGFDEAVEKYNGWVASGDLAAVRILDVIVPDNVVTGLFEIPKVRGIIDELS